MAGLAAQSFARPWGEEALAGESRTPGGVLWVALGSAGAPVGYLTARRAADELEVTSLAVGPAWRRSGVASALLDRALADAADQGVRTVHLEVRVGNLGARAFYAARGFAVRGRRAGYYAPQAAGGAREDALLLGRCLAAAGAAS